MTPHEAWATISGCFGAAVLILCLLADAARGLCRAARRAPQALHALGEGYTRARESAAMWLALRGVLVPSRHHPRHGQHCARHHPVAVVVAAPVPVVLPRTLEPCGVSPAQLTVIDGFPPARAGSHLGHEHTWSDA